MAIKIIITYYNSKITPAVDYKITTLTSDYGLINMDVSISKIPLPFKIEFLCLWQKNLRQLSWRLKAIASSVWSFIVL